MPLGFVAVSTRTRTAFWVDGVYTQSAATTATIQGSVQPVTGRDIEQMPEGEIREGKWKLYTQTALQFTDPSTPQSEAEVLVEGRWLRAVQINRWTLPGSAINHYKYILLEPGQNPR